MAGIRNLGTGSALEPGVFGDIQRQETSPIPHHGGQPGEAVVMTRS